MSNREYKILKGEAMMDEQIEKIEKRMNSLAKEGWRAISIGGGQTTFTKMGMVYVLLERETQ
ncbi:MAG: DUF4177 domain-containing protein [Thaumarchaeota archaeon]|nr:DUF4177 domain-containing protein [Nitrososphaerota archaeon]